MIAVAQSMRELFEETHSQESFSYKLRDFLDRFRDEPSIELIKDEPALLASQLGDQGRADAYLASTAAWLAQRHHMPTPPWARGTARCLEKPWFAARSHNLKMVLLQESPSAFRVRNLFVSANALHRA
jgi:hypothetical protein